MRNAGLLFVVIACASGCNLISEPGNGTREIEFTSDRLQYAAGDTARITLRNTTDRVVAYNLCLSARELRTSTGWSRIAPLRMCTQELNRLEPGSVATLIEEVTNEWNVGQYRMVTAVQFLGEHGTQEVYSLPFIVRD